MVFAHDRFRVETRGRSVSAPQFKVVSKISGASLDYVTLLESRSNRRILFELPARSRLAEGHGVDVTLHGDGSCTVELICPASDLRLPFRKRVLREVRPASLFQRAARSAGTPYQKLRAEVRKDDQGRITGIRAMKNAVTRLEGVHRAAALPE